MRRVWRHTESNNLLFLAAILKFHRAVALMAVDNKQSIRPNRLRIRVEVFKPGKRYIIVRPASRANL